MKEINGICKNCNQPFKITQKFCSSKCFNEWRKKTKFSTNWIDGRSKDKLWLRATNNISHWIRKFYKLPSQKDFDNNINVRKKYMKILELRRKLVPIEYLRLKAKEELNGYSNSFKGS